MTSRLRFVLPLLAVTLAGRAQVCPSMNGFVVPALVRAESLADLVGDIVGVCANTSPPGSFVVDVIVTLNVNITNHRDFGHGGAVTDAVLLVNEGLGGPPTPSFTAGRPMYGRLENYNTLRWPEVVLSGPTPFIVIRISNIRAAAFQLGLPSPGPFPTTQVNASVALSGGAAFTPGTLNVGIPLAGLSVNVQPGQAGESFRIRLSEGFASAFKTLGMPSVTPAIGLWEDGFPTPGSGINGGGATQSTRLLVRFWNVPRGVRIVAPGTVAGSSALRLQRVAGADANGAGGAAAGVHGPVQPRGGF